MLILSFSIKVLISRNILLNHWALLKLIFWQQGLFNIAFFSFFPYFSLSIEFLICKNIFFNKIKNVIHLFSFNVYPSYTKANFNTTIPLITKDSLFLDSINNINMICNDYDIFKESSTHFSSPENVLFKHAGSEMSNQNACKLINI